MEKGSGFVSVAEAASVLGVSDRQVRNMIAKGVLAAEAVGRAFIIHRDELAKVPRERKPGPKAKGTAKPAPKRTKKR